MGFEDTAQSEGGREEIARLRVYPPGGPVVSRIEPARVNIKTGQPMLFGSDDFNNMATSFR
jgi:hypothetical protein